MRILLSILLAFGFSPIYSQDTARHVEIDDNLTARFPFPFTLIKQDSLWKYVSTTKNIEFIIMRRLSHVTDSSKQEFKNSMRSYGIMLDSIDYIRDFTKISRDTVIGSVYGIFITLNNPGITFPVTKMHTFYTSKDSISYSIFAKLNGHDSTMFEQLVKKFLSDLHFKQDYFALLPEKMPGRKTRNIPGQIIGWITALSIMSYIIYNQVKKKITI